MENKGDVLFDNPQQQLAWTLMENTGSSLFLTGKAGTGKTTFLRKLRDMSRKRLVVLAPTGIAAINAGGVTIHSFFQLPLGPFRPGPSSYPGGKGTYQKFNKTKLRIIRSLDLLVIDEISMVRSDVLDAVDAVLRRVRGSHLPFGGVQLLMIGDLQQLPPVVRETDLELLRDCYTSFYFFESHALRSLPYETIELSTVYRQSDPEFISILNAIRDNNVTDDVLARLNSRYIPGFVPDPEARYIRLTTHNRLAQDINEAQLMRLTTPPQCYQATVSGSFPDSSYPAESDLTLKVGAQVMFIKNDYSGNNRYYNGMIGEVVELQNGAVYVRTPDSPEVLKIQAELWENMKYELDESSGTIKESVEGSFRQIPLRLAWAITIHKSQGLTFEHAVIDASRSFAHGQCYVALSRCKSLSGMVLDRPLGAASIICDPQVAEYIRRCNSVCPDEDRIADMAANYRRSLLDSLFDMQMLRISYGDCRRLVEEAYTMLFPAVAERWRGGEVKMLGGVVDVAAKFANQYRVVLDAPYPDESYLKERLKASANYFMKELGELLELVQGTPLECDNKSLSGRLSDALAQLREVLEMKRQWLLRLSDGGFTVEELLKSKALASLAVEGESGKSRSASGTARRKGQGAPEKKWIPTAKDVKNPEIYTRLVEWRRGKMAELDVPAFTIMHTKTLKAISEALPRTMPELLAIDGIGSVKAQRYGSDILQIINSTK